MLQFGYIGFSITALDFQFSVSFLPPNSSILIEKNIATDSYNTFLRKRMDFRAVNLAFFWYFWMRRSKLRAALGPSNFFSLFPQGYHMEIYEVCQWSYTALQGKLKWGKNINLISRLLQECPHREFQNEPQLVNVHCRWADGTRRLLMVDFRRNCRRNPRLLWECPWKELQNEPPLVIAGP